jgi:phytoene desaturase
MSTAPGDRPHGGAGGGDTFYALSPVPHLGHDDGVDWQAEAEVYRQKMQKRAGGQLLPGLRAHL